MSTRIVMTGTGLALVAVGAGLAVSHGLETGPVYPYTILASSSLIYTIAAVFGAVGGLVWMLAPQERPRRRTHVQLERRTVEDRDLRPTAPTRSGSTPSPPRPRATAPTPSPPSAPPMPTDTGLAPLAAEEEPAADDPRLRIDALSAEANRLKVEYGLGRVSASGYKAALAAIDRERTRIESELFASGRNDS